MAQHQKKCSVEGCRKNVECGGMCSRHYNQWIYRRLSGKDAGDYQGGWPCPICAERLGNLATHMSKYHGIPLGQWYAEHDIKCSQPDCEKIAQTRGMCKHHAEYWRNGGHW